jgi:uncharacterized protein
VKRFSAEDIIRELGLESLPGEGGFFRRTWTSPLTTGRRAFGSAIYFLLTPGHEGFSAFHRLEVDEIYHFYLGDPVELHLLLPDGSHELLVLGSSLETGETPQAIVPAGVIQGSRLVSGGRYGLLGTTMAPEFVPEDFALIPRAELARRFPGCGDVIEALTRE